MKENRIRHRIKIQRTLGTSFIAYCSNCGVESDFCTYAEEARFKLKEKFKILRRRNIFCKDIMDQNKIKNLVEMIK